MSKIKINKGNTWIHATYRKNLVAIYRFKVESTKQLPILASLRLSVLDSFESPLNTVYLIQIQIGASELTIRKLLLITIQVMKMEVII